MEITDAMIEEIRRGARQAEYGKVLIEIEMRGPDSNVDVVVTTRKRFQNEQIMTTGVETADEAIGNKK
jgi:hypothetical protein